MMIARRTGLLRLIGVSILVAAALLIATGIPSQAQKLELFEDFESKYIDPDKWVGAEGAGTGVLILESGRLLKAEPTYGYRGLDLIQRAYANMANNTGASSASTGLYFRDGRDLRTIQATIQVKKIQMATCSTNAATVSESRARMGGTFFNTGTPFPNGSYQNDVFAYISLVRTSSDSPSDPLSIVAKVFICDDENCINTTPIGSADLGSVAVNQKVKLRLTWEPDKNRFVFQKGKGAELSINYSVSDTNFPGAPLGGAKRLQIHHYAIPNCTDTTSPRPYNYMDVFFDSVYVTLAAP